MRVAIIANGDTPRHAVPRAAFAAADLRVACDGALAAARALGHEPDYVVGDGDSLSAADRNALGDRFVRVTEQDTNDLCKAFRFVQSMHRISDEISVALLGTTGLREDHALANIFHLIDFAAEIPDTSIITDYGTFVVVRDEQTFPRSTEWTSRRSGAVRSTAQPASRLRSTPAARFSCTVHTNKTRGLARKRLLW